VCGCARSPIRASLARALCAVGQGGGRVTCAARTCAQYWFFLRKVVCKPFGFQTFLPFCSSAAQLAPRCQQLLFCCSRRRVPGISRSASHRYANDLQASLGAGRPPVKHRRLFQASGARRLSRVASGHFARKTGGASPCTAAHTPEDKSEAAGQCFLWPAALIYVDPAYRASPPNGSDIPRHKIFRDVGHEGRIWILQPAVM
jgi:hypothetical protein